MFDAMKWLVKDAKANDSLFFHCNYYYYYSSPIKFFFKIMHFFIFWVSFVDSGHGGQVKDETGKECDGMDEGM